MQQVNYELPIFSINHDVIKDRSIILYDKGRDITVQTVRRSSSDFDDEDEEKDSKKADIMQSN